MIRKRIGKKKNKNGKIRQSTTWQAVVRRSDYPSQTKTFKTKREAEDWAISVESAMVHDEFVPNKEAKRRSIRELLERYRKIELPKKRDQRNENRYVDFWIGKLGNYRISAVSRPVIVGIRDEMAETRAPATVNRHLALLRHAFNVAVTDWEWANKNPLQRIMLTEPRGRDRHLSDRRTPPVLESTPDIAL